MGSLFIENAFTPEGQFFYLSVVITVIVSVTLHELAHGWAALWEGDTTPRDTGRMTFDPLKHMGGWSLVALFVVGLAWGRMPVNPSAFRHRRGDAIVSAAGPAMNLLLSAVGLLAAGLLLGGLIEADPTATQWRGDALRLQNNTMEFCRAFGGINLVLAVFNLFPVPPLDGSRILATFHRGYARLISDPSKQHLFLAAFVAVFLVIGWVMGPLFDAADAVIRTVAGI